MSSDIILDGILLVVLLVLGVPVPICFAAAALLLIVLGEFGTPMFLISAGYSKLSSIVLLAIPLYILAGGLMSHGGIAGRLVDFAESIAGRFKGGLGLVVIIATAVFGAISGMASSAVAAIGGIMIPRLVERGYSRNYAVSLVACSSVLALLIPPSASMIIFGWVTNTSITALFLAPVVPGLLLISLFIFWNRVMTRNMPIVEPEPLGFRDSAKVAGMQAKRAAFGLAMPLIILGCIYGGVTTPTEAAAIAVVYAIPVGFLIYRDLDWSSFYSIVWKSAQTSGVLMVLIFFASMLARLFTMENVPQEMMGSFLSVTENKILLLLMINLFLVVIGMFMDDVSGILLVSPMLLPIMLKLGIDPVHFGAIVAVNLGMGLITPPTAPILYFAAMVGNVKLAGILKPTLVFVLCAYLPVVLLTTFLPELSMALPRFILGID